VLASFRVVAVCVGLGLADYAPSPAERAAGMTGAFELNSSTFAIVGSIEAGRFGTTGITIDLFFDTFSTRTTESALVPDPNVLGEPSTAYDLKSQRLGIAGRAIFRSASRLQPSVSFGGAYADISGTSTLQYPGSTFTQSFTLPSSSALDLLLSGGFDISLQKDVRRGMRARVELGVDYRGYDSSLYGFNNRTAGPLGYRALLGFVYRHEPVPKKTARPRPITATRSISP